jgi:hypothetical protein
MPKMTLPPAERTIETPPGGWKANTIYVVKVAFKPTNPIHTALLHVGFLDDKGRPAGYSEIWRGNYERPIRFGSAHYLAVVQEVITLGVGA